MGIVFGIISKWVRAFTVPVGFLFLAAGFGIMIIKPSAVCLLIGCLLAGMSISLASPQCILQVSELCSSSQELALAAALIMAVITGFFSIKGWERYRPEK